MYRVPIILGLVSISVIIFGIAPIAAADAPSLGSRWIGYTELRTNLPGGRHTNVATMRACAVRDDGSGRRVLGEELVTDADTWTQFVGWSPDGKLAVIGRGWESRDNAQWEEEHKAFRMTEGWRSDMLLVDFASNHMTNVTSVERVSEYNSGLFFWPGNPNKLGFQALIGGNSHPFSMDLDGRNKCDLTQNSTEFAYGFSASPDGRRIAYHKSYQVWLADADGSNATHIKTNLPFNFAPQWSPDGEWLMFLAGEHYDCHPHVVHRQGSGLRKLADRQGHRGVVEFLDVFDFHGGSSDVPAWSTDGHSVFYTAKSIDRVELMRVSLAGESQQLTHSEPGTWYYHPQPSRDGKWLVCGTKRQGVRQIGLIRTDGGEPNLLTQLELGWGAMWPSWRPESHEP